MPLSRDLDLGFELPVDRSRTIEGFKTAEVRLRAEERMMLETFGDDYVAYMARTKRLLPRLW